MIVKIVFSPKNRKRAYFLLKAVKHAGINVKALQFNSTWRDLSPQRLEQLFSDTTHLVLQTGEPKKVSSWMFYLIGFFRGGNKEVLFSGSSFPDPLLNEIPSFSNVEDVLSYIKKTNNEKQTDKTAKEAREEIFDSGLAFSPEGFASCVERNDLWGVKNFLAAGFSADTCTEKGVSMLSLAIRKQHRNVAEYLLESGADINHINEDRGTTPLMEASVRGETELVKLLMEKRPNMNIQSKNGQTALMMAVGEGYADIANEFFREGIDLSVVDHLGMTAEKYARLFKHEEIIKLFEHTDFRASSCAE
ncbi:MAG: ankyrin repeat domain-containing protein [Spirochaetia bacterium]